MKKVTGYEMLGKRIKECRLEMGLSVEEVAEIMGVKTSMYLSYEAGQRDIRSRKLLMLSRLFHVSCDYLLGLTDIKTPAFDEWDWK